MAIILAIPTLYDKVITQFGVDGNPDVKFFFGWREPARQLQSFTRIVCYPGNPQGSAGEILPPRNPGDNPRALANLSELCTWEITGNNTDAPENERAQYQATRELFCAWYRAVYLAAFGTYEIVSVDWVIDHNERRRGACLRVVLGVLAILPDSVIELAPVDVSASLNVDLLDLSENLTVEPG